MYPSVIISFSHISHSYWMWLINGSQPLLFFVPSCKPKMKKEFISYVMKQHIHHIIHTHWMDGWMDGQQIDIVPSFNRNSWVWWADWGWEVETCFLRIWALCSSLPLINWYSEWSLPCLTATMRNAWGNVGKNAFQMGPFIYGCFSLFLLT